MRGEDTEKHREKGVNERPCVRTTTQHPWINIYLGTTQCNPFGAQWQPMPDLPGQQAFACFCHIDGTESPVELGSTRFEQRNQEADDWLLWPIVHHELSCCNAPETPPVLVPSASEIAFPSSSSAVSPRSSGASNTSTISGKIRRISLAW